MASGKRVYPAGPLQGPRWVHRFAVVTASATLVLIFIGGLVTSTGSGLAVPDWPLSFGQVFPPMVGGVLFEHGHRLAAALVGMLMVTLVVLLAQWEPRAWVRRLSWVALVVVMTQGMLGGLTVLLRLPTMVSVTHACLAQAFLCLTVTIAVCTSSGWETRRSEWIDITSPSLHALTRVTVGVIFLQLILGALMRHTGAGAAITDFPLSNGRLIPEFSSHSVVIHFLHRLGAFVVTVMVGWTVARVLTAFWAEPSLRRPALCLSALLIGQLVLGALTIWTYPAVVPMTAHVMVGAAVLAASVLLALRAHQLAVQLTDKRSHDFVSKQVTA